MSESYSYGTLPAPTDTVRVLMSKLLTASGYNPLTTGNGAPGSNPTNTSLPALYVDLAAGNLYIWNVATQSWL